MFFLLWRRASRYYPLLALLATHLAISMPAPPSNRSPEEASGGFSNVPKILEIQLPLKIASKDDLVAWAKYVMGLMASKINITLTTVKESAPKISGNTRSPETVGQSQNSKASVFRSMDGVRQPGNIQAFAISKNFENARYAEDVRNHGSGRNYERVQNPGTVRPSGNNRHSENLRIPQRNMNLPLPNEILIATTNTPTLRSSGLTTNSLLDNRQLHSSFANLGILQTTVQSPLAITANINIPRPRIKEQEFKNTFDVPSSLKLNNQRLFVPPIPDFGPILNLNNDIFRNANTISTPSRAYLPVTTTDSLKFPTDPFATRYFFDGVERNLSGNLDVLPHDIAFTTHRPLIFNDEIALPVRSVDLASHRNSTGPLKPLFKLPFEAVITITRENSGEAVTERTEKDKYFVAPTRNPLVEFPPYFDTNYTVTNESGQINVVFDDGSQVTEALSDTRKGNRKNQEKKKDSSSKQRSKKQKTATQKPATQKPATQKPATQKPATKKPSPIAQFLKMFTALRRNSSLATDLTPPPLRPQSIQTPFRTQVSTERPSSFRQGRRNETSQKQEFEDDDDEDNGNGSENDSAENDSGENDSNGDDDDDVESNDGGNNKASDESSSSESDSDYDDDDDDDEGGSIKAIIGLLQLVGPILEDLSDPESDTDIAEVIEAAVPILQDLSEGDGETEGLDIPGVLVPVLLQLSGGPDGRRDSAAILRPILQLSAPLIGPLVGPLIVPLSQQSSQPPGSGGSNAKDLIQSISSPLSQTAGPGKMSMLSKLIAGVVSSLSKSSNTYGKGKSDITSLVKAVVAGSVAGTSAGSSGGRDSYAAPTSYGNDHGGGGGGGDSYYSPGVTSTETANPLLLLGSSIKDIFNAILKVVASLVSAISSFLGASASSSVEQPSPAYGPSTPSYGAPSPYMVPPRQSGTGTTRAPPRRLQQ